MDAYISRIVNGYSDIDMEDYVGQPALAGTDNESAEYLTVEELYREVGRARRQARKAAKALPFDVAAVQQATGDYRSLIEAHADGEVDLTAEEFVSFCAGLAAEPF